MIILFIFVIGGYLGVYISPCESVVYYIKPWPTVPPNTYCPSSYFCAPLNYFLYNNHEIFEEENHEVILMFLSGTHVINVYSDSPLKTRLLHLIGVDHSVKISGFVDSACCIQIETNTFQLYMKNLTIDNLTLTLQLRPRDGPRNSIFIERSNFYSLTLNVHRSIVNFSNVEIKDVYKLHVEKCHMYLGNSKVYGSPISIFNSHMTISDVQIEGYRGYRSAVYVEDSFITLYKTVSFHNNSGTVGGALHLISSKLIIAEDANVSFVNNLARFKGGAIYAEPENVVKKVSSNAEECFYQFYNLSTKHTNRYSITFANNFARIGGNDIYGASLKGYCKIISTYYNYSYQILHFFHFVSKLSSVSAEPSRVCLCDSYGQPQCADMARINGSRDVYPGETITIHATVVGGDFGPVAGMVFAQIMSWGDYLSQTLTDETVGHKHCKRYSVNLQQLSHLYNHRTQKNIKLCLTHIYADYCPQRLSEVKEQIKLYNSVHVIRSTLRSTPVTVSLDFKPCPSGFAYDRSTSQCNCYPNLFSTTTRLKCTVQDGIASISWSTQAWVSVNVTGRSLLYSKYCPFDYCMQTANKSIIIVSSNESSNLICAFNHSDTLCGSCQEDFSLAFGTSHCIECKQNHNLALLVFFAAAGFLLVFFISVLNLTVTQGIINGFVFYANVVWTYQVVLFPQHVRNPVIIFLKTFIAWLNLDFGISTCFFVGLNAFWKTWLQFTFPFYIWSIAGFTIAIAKHSTRFTKFLSGRAVPLMTTLFLLSYTKLVQNIGIVLSVSKITKYTEDFNITTIYVWSLDGSLGYCHFPHILLFLVALSLALFLWLPYSLFLLLVQWHRKVSHHKLFRWTTKFTPIFDAYLAPLKDKYHYLLGVSLLYRGALVVVHIWSHIIEKSTYIFALFTCSTLLLIFVMSAHPYRRRLIHIFNVTILVNLVLLSGASLYTQHCQLNGDKLQTIVIGISTGIVFLQFCAIVIYEGIKLCLSHCGKLCSLHATPIKMFNNLGVMNTCYFNQDHIEQKALEHFHDSVHLRDSILIETY